MQGEFLGRYRTVLPFAPPDERDARRFALTSTPVVIIGKRLYKGFVDPDELAKVVRER